MGTRAGDAEHSATVTVHRTATHDVRERELYVSIDHGPNSILRFGDSVSRRIAEFDIAPGQEIRFKAVNVRGKGYLWTAAFFGFALMFTELEAEGAEETEGTD
jgi:hypothetical protein